MRPAMSRGRTIYIGAAVSAAVVLTLLALLEWRPSPDAASAVGQTLRLGSLTGSNGCVAGCGVGDSRGRCVDGACICDPGYGSLNCSFSSMTLLGVPDVFAGFPKRPIDEQNWSDPADVYETIAAEANAQFIIEIGTWKGEHGGTTCAHGCFFGR